MTMETETNVAVFETVGLQSLRRAIVVGLVFGVVGIYLAAVGLLPMIYQRMIVVGVLNMGETALLALAILAGVYLSLEDDRPAPGLTVIQACLAGGVAGLALAVLAGLMEVVDLRSIFIALSPDLGVKLLFGLAWGEGAALLVICGSILAGIGAAITLSPPAIRKSIVVASVAVLTAGSFQELIQVLTQYGGIIGMVRETFYSWEGLKPGGALIIAVIAAAASWISVKVRGARPAPTIAVASAAKARTYNAIIIVVVLVLLPLFGGSYVGQVMMLVGLYCLMGMGLNLEVGLAGLLDLGFVAFFAVGAYTTAMLTADSAHALSAFTNIPSLSFWIAMPISVLAAVVVGILFGIPVLGVRGDYLAVATLGLGEIVRVIVMSDAAAPLLAGGQGILQIPKPWIGSFELRDPVYLYFLTLACAAVAAFVAHRLEGSRLGRAWMAVRDDEDIAEAIGINLVKVKLLGYALGAAFAGLSGSIFAVMVGSIYPNSFQLLVSINVLALIVVGGMGSLRGIVVGAAVLIGLPELLREFAEYRYLVYGVALIVMMRIRPEGLWPSPTRRRELRDAARVQ